MRVTSQSSVNVQQAQPVTPVQERLQLYGESSFEHVAISQTYAALTQEEKEQLSDRSRIWQETLPNGLMIEFPRISEREEAELLERYSHDPELMERRVEMDRYMATRAHLFSMLRELDPEEARRFMPSYYFPGNPELAAEKLGIEDPPSADVDSLKVAVAEAYNRHLAEMAEEAARRTQPQSAPRTAERAIVPGVIESMGHVLKDTCQELRTRTKHSEEVRAAVVDLRDMLGEWPSTSDHPQSFTYPTVSQRQDGTFELQVVTEKITQEQAQPILERLLEDEKRVAVSSEELRQVQVMANNFQQGVDFIRALIRQEAESQQAIAREP